MKFFAWGQPSQELPQQAPQPHLPPPQVQRSQNGDRLSQLMESRDRLIDKFCDNVEDIITREPSFEESVTVLAHLFPNQLLTADSVSPYNSFTDQGRCQAVNKRGKKQCANKCMNGSRFCRTHHDITHF